MASGGRPVTKEESDDEEMGLGLAGPECPFEQLPPCLLWRPSPPSTPFPTWAPGCCRDARGQGAVGGGSRTCSLGHDHLGFAARAIAFHSVGGHSDGVGGLRLQVCDDHLLQAGVASVREAGRGPPSPPSLQGWAQTGWLWGLVLRTETCTRPHAETPTGSRSMLRWPHAASLEQGAGPAIGIRLAAHPRSLSSLQQPPEGACEHRSRSHPSSAHSSLGFPLPALGVKSCLP